MKKQSHLNHWGFGKKLAVLHDRNLRKAHRLFKSFPVMDYEVIVDIGAHRGEFSLRSGAFFEPRKIWLVEADPFMFGLLREEFGNRSDWEIVHSAISNVTGEIELRINEHRESSSILTIQNIAGETFGKRMQEVEKVVVPALSLDDFFSRNRIDRVDLLKVDIQGAERMLIEGGVEALKCVRQIYIEVNFERFYEGAPVFSEIDGMLRDRGFKLRSFHETRLGGDGSLAYANALYIQPALMS